MQLFKISCLALFLCTIFSCKVPTDVVYFQNNKNLEEITSKKINEPIFKPNDILSIVVLAADMDTARPFNLSSGSSQVPSSNTPGVSSSTSNSAASYLIDNNGKIEFPVLGELEVAGLTRIQVKEKLKKELKVYINEPIVKVRLENFKITILGEVNKPGSYNISNERITIIEALGLAGDLTIKGKRKNIVVIRENDTIKKYYKIDLTSKNIFNEPVYYLAQNDIVYIEPNDSKVMTSKTNANTLTVVFGIIGTVVSVLGFILLAN